MPLEIEELKKKSIKERDAQIAMLMDQLEKQNSSIDSTQMIKDPSRNNAHQDAHKEKQKQK